MPCLAARLSRLLWGYFTMLRPRPRRPLAHHPLLARSLPPAAAAEEGSRETHRHRRLQAAAGTRAPHQCRGATNALVVMPARVQGVREAGAKTAVPGTAAAPSPSGSRGGPHRCLATCLAPNGERRRCQRKLVAASPLVARRHVHTPLLSISCSSRSRHRHRHSCSHLRSRQRSRQRCRRRSHRRSCRRSRRRQRHPRRS